MKEEQVCDIDAGLELLDDRMKEDIKLKKFCLIYFFFFFIVSAIFIMIGKITSILFSVGIVLGFASVYMLILFLAAYMQYRFRTIIYYRKKNQKEK